ncbi:MAG: SBBP repeat-containing protein, partial [Gammaproteobacteria bacterium]
PWAGVAYALRAHGANVEQVFTLDRGVNGDAIRMRIAGARSLQLKNGELIAETGNGPVTFSRPAAYQLVDGSREAVSVAYVLHGNGYGFRLGTHDPSRPLVVDPLIQATYLGGTGFDSAAGAVVAPDSGNVYVAGQTQSSNFPGTTGGAQPQNAGMTDAFVAEFNPGLTTLLQATYLGGSNTDFATAIALGPPGTPHAGDVYIIGDTQSTDFPGTTGGAQPNCAGSAEDCANNGDAFIALLDPTLGTLEQATYLGGTDIDDARALALTPEGSADPGTLYVGGRTLSGDFPGTAGGAQPVGHAGSYDAFVAVLTPDLTGLTQTTYLGGSDVDEGFALGFDPATNEVYVAGDTSSADFPCTMAGGPPPAGGNACGAATAGAQESYAGGFDAFVAVLNSSLTSLIQSTYLGGSALDEAQGLSVDSDGIYIAGKTFSPDLPGIAGGAQPVYNANGDAFVAELNPALTTLVQSSFLGGSGLDAADALAISTVTNGIYVAGQTQSIDFPCTDPSGPDPDGGTCAVLHSGAQPNFAGTTDAFVALLSPNLQSLSQASYLGGRGADQGNALALAPGSGTAAGNVYMAGLTTSANFPGTTGAAQAAYAGSSDAYAAVLSPDLQGPQVDMTLAVDAPASIGRGNTYSYKAEITNTTAPSASYGGDATNVVFTDILPPQATHAQATASQGEDCEDISGVITCNLGTIAANGGNAKITIKVKAASSGSAANVAKIKADQAFSPDSISSVTTITSIPFPNANNGAASAFSLWGLLALGGLSLLVFLIRRRRG